MLAVAAIAALSLAAAGCTSGNTGSAPNVEKSSQISSDASSTITVWTDATRATGFEAYQKLHPNVKMDIVTIDNSQILQKIQLDNRAGSGWPDIIYPLSTNYLPELASQTYSYFAQPLENLYPQSFLSGFGSTVQECTIDGHLYCVPNDIAPAVLYYNTATMKKFGYQVPTTMQQYLQIGLEVAKQHPGYYVEVPESVPSQPIVDNFYASSGCPFGQSSSQTSITINWSDPRCSRVTSLLDQLVKAGSYPVQQLNSGQELSLGKAGKILMSINAVWYPPYIFGPSFAWANGTLGVAPQPSWGSGTTYAGAEGGGGYIISRHSQNLAGVLKIAQFMASSPAYQLTAPTFPAYQPLDASWLAKNVAGNVMYAKPTGASPTSVYEQAAKNISPSLNWIKWDPVLAFSDSVTPGLRAGKSIASQLSSLQSLSVNTAKTVGYTSITTG